MAEERQGWHDDSVELVYGIARAAYVALITAAGLFFAGIVWFSLEITPRVRQLADQYLLSSPRTTELQILGNTVDVIHRNERSLQRADSLFGLAVLLLFLGTFLIGARVAMLLL